MNLTFIYVSFLCESRSLSFCLLSDALVIISSNILNKPGQYSISAIWRVFSLETNHYLDLSGETDPIYISGRFNTCSRASIFYIFDILNRK